MALVSFAIVFFGPLLPAALVFFLVPKRRRSNTPGDTSTITGTLLGFNLRVTGASATYIAFVLVALVVHERVAPAPSYEKVNFTLDLSGDSGRIANFVRDSLATSKINLFDNNQTLIGTIEPLALEGPFLVNASGEVNTSLIGRTAHPELSPRNANARFNPATIQIASNNALNLVFDTGNRIARCLEGKHPDWLSAVQITFVDFELEPAVDRMRHVLVFVNRTNRVLSEITLTGHDFDGLAELFMFDAYKLPVEVVKARTVDLGDPDLFTLGDGEIVRRLERTHADIRRNGDFIGQFRFEASERGEPKREKRGDVELRSHDTTIRVGPVLGGIAPDESISIGVDVRIKRTHEAARDPNPARKIGQRAAKRTCLLYLVGRMVDPQLHVETDTILTEYIGEDGGKTRDYPSAKVRRSTKHALVEVQDVPETFVARLFFNYASGEGN